jgi:hypothetical protein
MWKEPALITTNLVLAAVNGIGLFINLVFKWGVSVCGGTHSS